MNYRIATDKDIPLLVRTRKQQLIDEGIKPDGSIDQELEEWFEEALKNGSLVQILAEEDGNLASCGAVVFMKFPPTWTNHSGMKGYITNMYTDPAYRRRGLASDILERLAQEALKRNVFRLWLGASKMGRPVYEKFGFVQTGEWLDLNLKNR